MKNYEGFEGKIAVVTGGGSGIGKGICNDLADQGAIIAVADINLEGAKETVAELEGKAAQACAVQMDVSDEKSVKAGFADVIARFGTIDILVNNAATPGSSVAADLYTKPSAEWDDVFAIDLKGVVLCVGQVYRLMREKKSGKIINIASISGRMASPSVPEYGAVKAGVINYTQTLAKDMTPYDVNVNAVCPGFLFTKLWQRMGATIAEKYPEGQRPTPYQIFTNMIKSLTPLGREQQVEDVAHLVTFLCSGNAKNITGQAINVDGGTCMS
jgi:NAD(P)-dependent dehydrogenase (short-subunit alcohol dehydrogenase family)